MEIWQNGKMEIWQNGNTYCTIYIFILSHGPSTYCYINIFF
jgi:hypothetical protein